jgi:hypothetical protein
METFRAFMEVFPALAMLALVCVLAWSVHLFATGRDKDGNLKK